MGARDNRRILLTALFLMALSGLLLHLRIHPIMAPDKAHPGTLLFRASFVSATVLPLVDVVLVTFLFAFRRTAVYGYLLNGFIVIYGTVLMSHFSIAALVPRHPPLMDWVLKSTLPDIGLAWADFLLGAVLYRSWQRGE